MEGLIGPDWDGTFPIRTYFDEILAGTGNDQLPDDFLIPGSTTTPTTTPTTPSEESKDNNSPTTTTDGKDSHADGDCELCTFCDTCGGCPNCCSCDDKGKLFVCQSSNFICLNTDIILMTRIFYF